MSQEAPIMPHICLEKEQNGYRFFISTSHFVYTLGTRMLYSSPVHLNRKAVRSNKEFKTMRRLVIGVVAGMLLPLSPAFAEADATVVSQVQAATQNASTPEQIAAAVQQLLESAETPEQQQAILTAALSLNASNTAVLAAINTAAVNAGVPATVISQAQVASNTVPTVTTPSVNSTPVVPPTINNSTGTSGGGTSPT